MDMVSNVAESFSNNLIVEDRYRMILDGLQVTLLITLSDDHGCRRWARHISV